MVICFVVDVQMIRFLIPLFLSAGAIAQIPLIAVNSAEAELPAGARDVVASITVDPSAAGGDFLAVMLTAEGVRIEIELPDGRRVTQTSASSAGFEWEVAGEALEDDLLFPGLQGKVNNLILMPPQAPPGKYLIHADASGVKEVSALMVVFMPSGGIGQQDTVTVALTSAEMFYRAGDKVELIGAVFEGGRGVNDARLSGAAVAIDKDGLPVGTPMPVTLERSSGAGSDGNYHGELPTTAVGKYDVGLKVTGKYADGKEFERNAATSIDIQPRRAQIVSVTERPLDDDGNGLIDRIEFTARIKVEMAGRYSLRVDMGGMQAYGIGELAVGEGIITAFVEHSGLIRLPADGPYKIEARLFRQESSGDGFASLLADAGMSRAYKRSSFDHGPIYFVGTAIGKPSSPTGKRPFGQFIVTFDVFTPGGNCLWYGGVSADNFNEIEFINSGGPLPKGRGKIIFSFDGFKISNDADGKPLWITKVSILCGRFHATPERSVAMPLFPAGTFVKGAPAFELFLPRQTIALNRGQKENLDVKLILQGGFDQIIDFKLEGLPEGIIAEKPLRKVPARRSEFISFPVTASPDTPLGRYQVTVHGRYKTMERTKVVTLVVDR
jgi:hypothetical protein